MQQEHIQHENDNISEGKDLFSCTMLDVLGNISFMLSSFLMLQNICAYKKTEEFL